MKKLKRALYLLVLFVAVILIWGNLIEPKTLDVTRVNIKVPKSSSHLDGKTIAFISDFQIGMWLGNESTISKAVDQIIEQKPLAVLIGGDFIYHPTDEDEDEAYKDWDSGDMARTKSLVRKAISLLSPLQKNGIQVFAVLGNHDYSMGHSSARLVDQTAQHLTSELSKIGIRVLNNESTQIATGSAHINVVGIAPHYPDYDDPEQALSKVSEAPSVLFMHNANSIKNLATDRYLFAVAGHTHGGQIRIPGFPSWSWTSLVPHAPEEVMGDGWIKHFGDKKVYVNRGIGFSNLPIRINCKPELTIFKFKKL